MQLFPAHPTILASTNQLSVLLDFYATHKSINRKMEQALRIQLRSLNVTLTLSWRALEKVFNKF